MQFLRGKQKEDFETVAQTNFEIRQAVNTLYELSADEQVREEYAMRQKAWRDRISQNEAFYLEGKRENAMEGARNFKKLGILTNSQIATAMGLSEEEVAKL
jgi:predicted transposase/invertase (TIGR01784 family)